MDKTVVLEEEAEEEKANRLADYKTRSVICDQETRRLQLLTDQKRRRERTLNDFRNLDLFSDWDEDEISNEEQEVMVWTNTKPKQPRLKDLFMLSEWMVSVPDEFDVKWLFVLCPVGKRCLVRCTKGSTSVYGKQGQRLARFQSALPNGSQKDGDGHRYSNSEVTILDCIWNPQIKCYFVLDLLSWKGQFYMDTEASFRAFWVKSKIGEIPSLSERSEYNAYPFVSLDYHQCDLSVISSITQLIYFSDEVKLDGILFYHSEGYYTPGSTPLVLWLKPFMLPEMFNVMVPEMFDQMKPPSYVNMEQYIMDFEERQIQRKKKRKKNGKTQPKEDETEMLFEES